jgi:hypothetical protein
VTELLQRPAATRLPTDEALLHRVLTPYRGKGCEYLKSAEVICEGDVADGGRLAAECTFEIPESCYIDSTGHFNSVEFNICYNQMAYYTIAKSVQDGLLEQFRHWTLDDFWRLQLGDILITDFRSSFRSQMRGRRFDGELTIVDVARLDRSDQWAPLVVLRTDCRFSEPSGGRCSGGARIAITNPPEPAP